jgi:predicted lactoylglutathione lyase
MVFSDTIFVMLLTHDKFRQFTPKAIADARATSEVLLYLSSESREAVDGVVEKAGRQVAAPIRVRSRIMALCTAAASRIPTGTSGK